MSQGGKGSAEKDAQGNEILKGEKWQSMQMGAETDDANEDSYFEKVFTRLCECPCPVSLRVSAYCPI